MKWRKQPLRLLWKCDGPYFIEYRPAALAPFVVYWQAVKGASPWVRTFGCSTLDRAKTAAEEHAGNRRACEVEH